MFVCLLVCTFVGMIDVMYVRNVCMYAMCSCMEVFMYVCVCLYGCLLLCFVCWCVCLVAQVDACIDFGDL